MKKQQRVTISVTVNLQNYENIRVEVEAATHQKCFAEIKEILAGLAKNPGNEATRQYIDSYMTRVLNVRSG